MAQRSTAYKLQHHEYILRDTNLMVSNVQPNKLLVTHSSSEPESLVYESDESLQEDPDEQPLLPEDPDELLELMFLGLSVISANFSVATGSASLQMSTSSSTISPSSSVRGGEQRPLAGIAMGEGPFLGTGRTTGARLLVTHSSSESLLSESDESLQEDPDEPPLLLEDPDELLELLMASKSSSMNSPSSSSRGDERLMDPDTFIDSCC